MPMNQQITLVGLTPLALNEAPASSSSLGSTSSSGYPRGNTSSHVHLDRPACASPHSRHPIDIAVSAVALRMQRLTLRSSMCTGMEPNRLSPIGTASRNSSGHRSLMSRTVGTPISFPKVTAAVLNSMVGKAHSIMSGWCSYVANRENLRAIISWSIALSNDMFRLYPGVRSAMIR